MKFSFRKKTNWNKPFSEKIARRIAVVSSQDLDAWIDTSLTDIGRAMISYHRTGQRADLENALLSAEVLHAMIDALKTRMFD